MPLKGLMVAYFKNVCVTSILNIFNERKSEIMMAMDTFKKYIYMSLQPCISVDSVAALH